MKLGLHALALILGLGLVAPALAQDDSKKEEPAKEAAAAPAAEPVPAAAAEATPAKEEPAAPAIRPSRMPIQPATRLFAMGLPSHFAC